MSSSRQPNRGKPGVASLLASVSRSFFLTVRVLPEPIRSPVGLGYLLARAADTIADESSVDPAIRLRHLDSLAKSILAGPDPEDLAALQREIRPSHPGEAALLSRLSECFDWLGRLAEGDRRLVVEVLGRIISGQRLDLVRFGQGGGVVALRSAAELDEYTYLVAGCVGDFWTRVCALHLPDFAGNTGAELLRLGVSFGKGLQLTNILRDLPEDISNGRLYLPADELRAVGADPVSMLESPGAAAPVFERWLSRAFDNLEDAFSYIRQLKPWRIRYACILPWAIGVRTLTLLREHPPLESGRRLKVSRGEVKKIMALALFAALGNGVLLRLKKSLSKRE